MVFYLLTGLRLCGVRGCLCLTFDGTILNWKTSTNHNSKSSNHNHRSSFINNIPPEYLNYINCIFSYCQCPFFAYTVEPLKFTIKWKNYHRYKSNQLSLLNCMIFFLCSVHTQLNQFNRILHENIKTVTFGDCYG